MHEWEAGQVKLMKLDKFWPPSPAEGKASDAQLHHLQQRDYPGGGSTL